MNNKIIYGILIAAISIFSLFAVLDLGTVKIQDASPNSVVSIHPVTKTSDVRGETTEDVGFSNGTHVWTGGMEQWIKASDGTFVPYVLSQNSTHYMVDNAQAPFSINKNNCLVTIYDNSGTIASNPGILISKDFWNVSFRQPSSPNWTSVDMSNTSCKISVTTNSSGIFFGTTKSFSIGNLNVVYAKRINTDHLESFPTVTNTDASQYYIKPIEQQIGINADSISADSSTFSTSKMLSQSDMSKTNTLLINKGSKSFAIWVQGSFNNINDMVVTKTANGFNLSGDFGNNITPLAKAQSFAVDPTYGYTTVAAKRVFNGAGTNSASCPSTADSSDNYAYLRLDPVGAGYTCTLLSYRWDISSIPSNSTITSASLRTTVTSISSPNNCDWVEIADDPNTASVNALYNDIRTGTRWLANDATCTTVQTNAVIPISSAGVTDIQNHLAGHWWATGIDENPETRTSVQHQIVFGGNAGDQNVALQVNYVAGGGGGGGGGTGITSINGDTTSAQTIKGVTGNTTVSTSAGTTTVNLGSNALVKGGDITNTKTSGTFRITAQPGVAICIGTGC